MHAKIEAQWTGSLNDFAEGRNGFGVGIGNGIGILNGRGGGVLGWRVGVFGWYCVFLCLGLFDDDDDVVVVVLCVSTM